MGSGRAGRAAQERPAYRLIRLARAAQPAPDLDAAQRAVVDHRGGPLLVLAGPGTGKTTTLVEAIVARVAAGADPDRLLALTFSRRAAESLRERISSRLQRSTATTPAVTFHSFAHALLAARRHPEEGPLRVMSGGEQDVAVRELLRGTALDDPERTRWPPTLAACLGTRGLAEEVRDVLARVAERDLDLERVAAAVAADGDADAAAIWRALDRFATEYADVLDARGVLDYAELIRRAVLAAESGPLRARLRASYDAVFVDEYQDTDPAQVRLLHALAGDGRDLIVFGDPDQAIYGFRGADVRAVFDFADRFRDAAGSPAAVLALRHSRRSVAALLAATRVLARRLPLAGLPVAAAREHRELTAPPPAPGAAEAAAGPAGLTVRTFTSSGAELAYVADALRRAHLAEGLPWSQMAVLVRSGTASIPAVRRALGVAGVPLAVAADEVPLGEEPAVLTLLRALRAAADPAALTPDLARDLLLSPLGGIDPADLRRLGRALRAEARAGGVRVGELAPSAQLIRDALADPRRLIGPDAHAARPAKRLGDLLATVRSTLDEDAPVQDALWQLWSGTAWSRRLARAAEGVGPAARRADRDLDAVCALFDVAERGPERTGARGVRAFEAEIAAQQIPGERPRQAERGEAVRVMTAHRSKGLEWDLVAVVGVQEGTWPDLRRRGSLLGADRLGPDGPLPPPSAAATLADERRLFYVAATRARRRLLVTAVATEDEDGERPSRFLGELGVEPVAVRARPARPLSTAAMVADLRAALLDPASSPAVRNAAAERLASLAELRDEAGRPAVPAADPRRWWAMAELTESEAPVRPPDQPIRLSGSAVQAVTDCPLRWFLAREARAEIAADAAAGFGNVLHMLAEQVAAGAPADLDSLIRRLDTVWGELRFDAGWQSADQRQAAHEALRRFLVWHLGRPDRRLLGAEVPIDAELAVPDGTGGVERVRLAGRLDRVELDGQGRVRVVDLKTGRTKPSGAQVAGHAQLGSYQAAVDAGALRAVAGDAPAGGAELVMLRHDDRDGAMPKVYTQPAPTEQENPDWVRETLAAAARRIRAEAFTPQPDEACERCPYRRACSGRPEGRQVIT